MEQSNKIEFKDRPIAITDLETTGLDPIGHEIIEIGLVLVKQDSLEVIDEWHTKVRPEHPESATTEALQINGYKPELWEQAPSLKVAMSFYRKKTKDAIFLAHNICFDWSFIYEAFVKTDLESLMDYHRIDLFSLGWLTLQGKLSKFNLVALCEHFGIPKEPDPHRALEGAKTALEVLRCLRKTKL